MRKFLILSRSYNENSGGYVVLHNLCDLINRSGGQAFIVPYYDNFELRDGDVIKTSVKFIMQKFRQVTPFKTNEYLLTPVLRKKSLPRCLDEYIVIYPEVVFGNPLNAPNVIRWFLHNPGHMTGKVFFGFNELYYRYHSGIIKYHCFSSKLSDDILKIVSYPLELYNEKDHADDRVGSAYCLRKGVHKKIVHDLSDSILIDGKSHSEIARIFKSVKVFISYDVYTAYSFFAALCGCDSIVIPDPEVSETTWLPNIEDRYGISYGFDNIEWSRSTRHLLKERVEREQSNNICKVRNMILESNNFFDNNKY